MNSFNTPILIIFIATYASLAVGHIPGLKLNRVGIVLLGAIAMMIFGGATADKAIDWINWPTMLLLFGLFVISAQLRLCGFYDRLAGWVAAQLDHPGRFLLLMMAVSGGLSAFLNNDVICLVFTPIVGTALLRKKINPVPFLVALAISSNIGASATLIGNAQNMLIAQVAHLNLGAYMLWSFVPVLFAMAAAGAIIWLMSRRHLNLATPIGGTVMDGDGGDYNRPHAIKGIVILVIVIGLFFTPLPKEIVALAAAAIHLASPKFRTEELLKLIDWPILVLFMGLFVVTGAFQSTGYGDSAVHWLAQSGFNLNAPVNLAIATAMLSNLINNSAAVMLLMKVVDMSHPHTGYVMALANSFGGNLIILGSVANIIVVQQARDLGVNISFRDFARLAIPVTLAALTGLLAWTALMS